MNKIFRYTIIAIFCGSVIMQTAVSAQDKSTGAPTGKPEKTEKTEKNDKPEKAPNGLAPITLEDLAVNFPEVEGWNAGEIQKYPTEDLGFSVNYESREGGKVTIYVYNGGRKTISSDLADKVIKDELNKAKGEIRKVADMGYYQNLKELQNDTVTLGGTTGKVKSLHTLYNFNAGKLNVTSEIYIFGHQNRFVKIRATRARDNNENGNKLVVALLKEIDNFFST